MNLRKANRTAHNALILASIYNVIIYPLAIEAVNYQYLEYAQLAATVSSYLFTLSVFVYAVTTAVISASK